jgi:dihydrolipoamide dehydrogenase
MKIIVIGGGPAGKTAAIEASQLDEEVSLIEKEYLGGKCLNEGCMVVSGLNDVAKFVKDSRKFQKLGITSNHIQVDFKRLSNGVKDTIAKIRAVHEAEIRETDVEVITGAAQIITDGSILVNGEEHPYDRLIIATGSRAYIPPVKGAQNAKTYKKILDFKSTPKELIIIGSGVIAAEFAGIFSQLGSHVHVLCRNQFLNFLDEDVKGYLVKKLLDQVDINENIQLEEIKKEGVDTDKGNFSGEVLLATGMTPNSDILSGIVDIGKRGEVIVNQKMETSHKDIYAAGDVIGGIGTTPVARMEGMVAARNACGIHTTSDYRFIPSSISLYYDVAFLTPHEQSEKLEPEKVVEGSIPGFAGPGSFWNVLDRNTGFTKVNVKSESGEIQDVCSISPSARTSMAYISKMMRDNYRTYDFQDFIETHPSTDPVYKLMRFFAKFE